MPLFLFRCALQAQESTRRVRTWRLLIRSSALARQSQKHLPLGGLALGLLLVQRGQAHIAAPGVNVRARQQAAPHEALPYDGEARPGW